MNDLTEAEGQPEDIRPVVADTRSRNLAPWLFGGALAIGSVLLFSVLNERRTALVAPSTIAPAEMNGGRIASPPPLALPQDYRDEYPRRYPVLVRREPREQPAPTPVARQAPGPAVSQEPAAMAQPVQRSVEAPVYPEPTYEPRPAVVYDSGRNNVPAVPPSPLAERTMRVTASRFANPSLTVPQGTVIPAVLETALDSTSPGAARALVSRNVFGFDGSRVLIPRGSRLYGEYGGEVAAGQKRAVIRWTRLMRPDGVIIALDSPASDPLGRAGVKGEVDNKFFARFGGAILQSVLDVGVGLATNAATDGVIVALPGSTQNVTQPSAQEVTPTLRVRHGTGVSVFVARDLDFSTVET